MKFSSQADNHRPGHQTSISACPESLDKWYCLNGATCFQVKIYDAILYNCWCPSGYQGLRCDYKYVERRSPNEAAIHNRGLQGSKLEQTASGLGRSSTQSAVREIHSVCSNLLIDLVIGNPNRLERR